MTFRVGQKVVCVDSSEGDYSWLLPCDNELTLNAIYEVEEVYPRATDGETLLRVMGDGWRASRFRPVTDISIFIAMLKTSKQGQDA